MYGILDFIGNRLMERERASVALHGPRLLLFAAQHVLSLLGKHLFAMALLKQIAITLAHLLLVVIAVSPVWLPLAAAILRRMLRQAMAKWLHMRRL